MFNARDVSIVLTWEDMELVKKDVSVKMKCLEAKYETQIQNEAIDLHVLIQKKTRGLMEIHKDVGQLFIIIIIV